MQCKREGYTVFIQHNVEHEKDVWMYTIRLSRSDEMLYRGFCKNASEAVQRVEERLEGLRKKKTA